MKWDLNTYKSEPIRLYPSQKDNSNQQQPSKMGFTSFICLASLLFVGVAFGQPRSQPAGCFCSGTITQDAGASLDFPNFQIYM